MLTRGLLPRLREALGATPVVFIEGPRACGKTTLVQAVFPGRVFDLTNRETLAQATADPFGWLESLPRGSAIDEAQLLPDIQLHLKRLVDQRRGEPGQFVVTGSVLLPRNELGGSAPLAGRSLSLRLRPFSQNELAGDPRDVVTSLFDDAPSQWACPPTLRPDLFERCRKGGFVQWTEHPDETRSLLLDEYVSNVLTSSDFARSRDNLEKLFRWLAACSGEMRRPTEFGNQLELTKDTVTRLLTSLHRAQLIDEVRALKREVARRETDASRLFAADTAFVRLPDGFQAGMGSFDEAYFGRLFETFVACEVFRLASWSSTAVNVLHWREGDAKSGKEVDVVLERKSDGKLLGIEVKAARDTKSEHFKGLKELQRQYGDRFHLGVVLHCGSQVQRVADAFWSAPFSLLWSIGKTAESSDPLDAALRNVSDRLRVVETQQQVDTRWRDTMQRQLDLIGVELEKFCPVLLQAGFARVNMVIGEPSTAEVWHGSASVVAAFSSGVNAYVRVRGEEVGNEICWTVSVSDDFVASEHKVFSRSITTEKHLNHATAVKVLLVEAASELPALVDRFPAAVALTELLTLRARGAD